MYRYSVDNAITFTSDDLVLFLESPFAAWMERLTFENPGHGIPPDIDGKPPVSPYRPQMAFAATLRASGRDFVQIDWDMEERKRRHATLEAMRSGVDFIVDGHLAVGPLAGPVNLLMRTSGFSELGDFLYMPGDSQGDTTRHRSLRLAFLADLLHSLQGQLPPQMLVIRPDADLTPLKTEDHIYYYRAVKQHFMLAQRQFRKHRMPDPAQSSHCGRWYDCANEVLRQRFQGRDDLHDPAQEPPGIAVPGEAAHSGKKVATLAGDHDGYDLDAVAPRPVRALHEVGTLAEQASRLSGGWQAGNAPPAEPQAGAPVVRLQPLNYIGESSVPPAMLVTSEEEDISYPRPPVAVTPPTTPDPSPLLTTGGWVVDVSSQSEAGPRPHPLDSPGFNISAHIRHSPREPVPSRDNGQARAGMPSRERSGDSDLAEARPSFSDRLNTSEYFDT